MGDGMRLLVGGGALNIGGVAGTSGAEADVNLDCSPGGGVEVSGDNCDSGEVLEGVA